LLDLNKKTFILAYTPSLCNTNKALSDNLSGKTIEERTGILAMSVNQKILSRFSGSRQKLVDIVGYFMSFGDDNITHALCAIGFTFDKNKFYVVAQEDDSFVLHPSDWRGNPEWIPISLTKKQPWAQAIGDPLLWSWVLYNQQGYFDGIQLEFAKNTSAQSTLVQLVALGSEIKQREVAKRCQAITFTQ
jgi:hypothetical protein